jgi:DNA-directed RNA polymerase specialized sigma24 family protein
MLLALTPESAASPAERADALAEVSERALFDAIRRGDERRAPDVFAALLPGVQATLRRVLGVAVPNQGELAQRCMERIIAELAGSGAPWVCSLEVWATSVTSQLALDVLRARSRERDIEVSWGDAMAAPRDGSDRAVGGTSPIDRLRWLLGELPRQEALCVVLCDVMGLRVPEVAVTLRVGLEHVKRALAAGHERLSRSMLLSA